MTTRIINGIWTGVPIQDEVEDPLPFAPIPDTYFADDENNNEASLAESALMAVPLRIDTEMDRYEPLRRRHQSSGRHGDVHDSRYHRMDLLQHENNEDENSLLSDEEEDLLMFDNEAAHLLNRAFKGLLAVIGTFALLHLACPLALPTVKSIIKIKVAKSPFYGPPLLPYLLGDDWFQEYLAINSFVLVYFSTPWSTSSSPDLEEAWTELEQLFVSNTDGMSKKDVVDLGKSHLKVIRISCMREANLCHRESIMTFPTVRFYVDGLLRSELEWAQTKGYQVRAQDIVNHVKTEMDTQTFNTVSDWVNVKNGLKECTLSIECSSPLASLDEVKMSDSIAVSGFLVLDNLDPADESINNDLQLAWNYQNWKLKRSGKRRTNEGEKVLYGNCHHARRRLPCLSVKSFPALLWFQEGNIYLPDYKYPFYSAQSSSPSPTKMKMIAPIEVHKMENKAESQPIMTSIALKNNYEDESFQSKAPDVGQFSLFSNEK